MKRLRPLSLALIASAAVAWSVPAFAVYPGNCANGKVVYNKNNPATGMFSCSSSTCHKSDPTLNTKNILHGAGNPDAINYALDGTGANVEMTALDLRNNLPLSAQDIDDLATWLFYAPSCPSGGTPNLQASPAPVAFGSVSVGATSATTTITIMNAGSASALAVTASTPDATHFPLSANTCNNVTVAAGGSCSFKVAFHPTAAGALSNNITVSRTGGSLTVGVSGTGTGGAAPGQLVIPSSLGFASQTVATTSAPSSVTITNTGGTAVAVSSVASNNPTEFAIASNTCATVNAGASCAVGVTFHPTATGARSASITITSNGVGSPQTISATGTGASAGGAGTLAMSSTVSFGSQAVGTTSAATTVAITNIGGTAVSVSSVGSSNPTEFAITSSSCATVNVGTSCSFTLTFKPGAVGTRTGSVSVVSNGTGSPQAIGVSGTGTSGSSPATVTVVEYYNAALDHYFITPVAAEVTLLDTKSAPFQDWSRSGFSFNSYANATAPASSVAICRFFNDHFAPKSSHFYAPHGLGCEATIAGFPDWKLEDDKLFNEMLPDGSGNCPAGTIPVYRLYNSGMGGAPNHRFVTSLAERQNMINKGYVAEGAGIGIGMCAPQ